MEEKKSIGKMLVGQWNTKTIVAVAVGAALFGVLMCYGGIPIFTNTSLSTAMLVPVIVGGLFGPLPACIAAGVGNVIADLIGGWGMWFDWSIGNAIMAFCVGLLPVYGANIKEGIFEVKHMIIYAIICIASNMVSFGVITPIFTVIFYGADLELTLLQSFAATLGNFAVLVVVGIPVLKLLANRYAKRANLTQENGETY